MRVKDEITGRELLVEYGLKLLEEGLVQGTWGNLSVRLDDQTMLVTPSGLDYSRVTPADMVKVETSSLKYTGSNKPTSEKALHGGIYEERPEVGAVIHTHAKYCSIFAAARMPLQIEAEELRKNLGEFLYCADYGLPGSKTLTKNTIFALGSKPGCIMSAHGMICVGEDMKTAFSICKDIEKAAMGYIESRLK